jgi:hypothetical protein
LEADSGLVFSRQTSHSERFPTSRLPVAADATATHVITTNMIMGMTHKEIQKEQAKTVKW